LRDRHGVPVHTHLMETRAQAVVGARWPGGLVAEMARQDLLNDRLAVAHGIWLTPDERATLARAGVTLVHNPASNLMLGSGILPWNETRAAGLVMALGTDSANTGGRHDMFATMRLAMMLPRISGLKYDSWPRETDVLTMATRNGAAVLGLRGQVGRIVPGQLADLVLVRRNASATVASGPPESVLVQHAGPEVVQAMIVDGEWVMREGRILAFDEEQAIEDAVAAIAEIRDRTNGAMTSVSAAVPYLSDSLGRFLM
ncbi:MAG: amidohydrolase family protein, partial [Acetobacteraceae bacterium]